MTITKPTTPAISTAAAHVALNFQPPGIKPAEPAGNLVVRLARVRCAKVAEGSTFGKKSSNSQVRRRLIASNRKVESWLNRVSTFWVASSSSSPSR